MNSILNWFYGTYFGGLYFEFLLWLDRKRDRPSKYLTPKEMAQIIRQYSLLNEGVSKVKRKVNDLVNSKTKEEYELTLSQLEDMLVFAERDVNTPQGQFALMLRQLSTSKSDRDITTHTEMAKMIDQRIQDHKELWDDQAKRRLMRSIRIAEKSGNIEEADKLRTEFKNKYGRSGSRP